MPTPARTGAVGAGSAVYSLGLAKDLCLAENLSGGEVSLHSRKPRVL